MCYDDFGYPTILWDVDPFDWKRPGPSIVKNRILAGTHPGSIILCHDIHSQTIDAMPDTLDTLLSKGYHFVTVNREFAIIPMTSAWLVCNRIWRTPFVAAGRI